VSPDWSRTPGEGRYARSELERRFLVDRPSPPGCDLRAIEDRYLQDTRLRLRTVRAGAEVVHKLTQKVRARPDDPSAVALTNTYLSAEEHAVLAVLPGDDLVKTRRVVPFEGLSWVVDVFGGRLSGLVLAEVEVADLHATLSLPRWVGREVSSEDAFSGGALAATPLDDVAEVLAQPRRADWSRRRGR